MIQKPVGKEPKKNRFPLLKRLVSLMVNKAPLKQYYLEIGVHFIKKGSVHKIGHIIGDKRQLHNDRVKVKAVTDVMYSFKSNTISPVITKMVINNSDIEKGG